LIFEDIDSLVIDKSRSYFLNEVDGLESNDDILMIGSTNLLDRLDPAIAKRPSRFDRKYHFKVPNMYERLEYRRYWGRKFVNSTKVEFPDEICEPIAAMTEEFSFAYLKELFISSLLELARGSTGQDEEDEAAAEVDVAAPESDNTSMTDGVVVEHLDADPKDSGNIPKTTAADVSKTAGPPAPGKAKRVLPKVEIPKSVKDNVLLRIVVKQARMLLDEMDNTDEEASEVTAKDRLADGRLLSVAPQCV
jgi:hypothetical protein